MGWMGVILPAKNRSLSKAGKENRAIGSVLTAVVFTVFLSIHTFGQSVKEPVTYPQVSLKANWISCPGEDLRGYGVFFLRKSFILKSMTDSFVIHVSGDQRYRLFVNGKAVCFGPARGDLRNWNYETIDIAPFLKPGENILAALIWNMGTGAPAAQVSYQTGFVLQGNSGKEQMVNTDSSWRIIRCKAYHPESFPPARLASYIVGDCDSVDFKDYPWGWQMPAYNDRDWKRPVSEPEFKYYNQRRVMQPRQIPLMEQKREGIGGIVRISGLGTKDSGKLAEDFKRRGTLEVPANKSVRIVFDRKTLTSAYPEINFSGGKGAKVKLVYAESLLDDQGLKGDRDQITGKHIKGYYDVFLPDGGKDRLFRPLWIRTYRYLQIEINTQSSPLALDRLEAVFSAYPFQQQATFDTPDSLLSKIWRVGWRTARLCAQETYMDCPYYEQLQYVGDTRIQALISLYVSGDDRLMRNAIEQFHQSQTPDGLTTDAYPAGNPKYIPPFSLFWVSMLYDYWLNATDPAFVKGYLIPIEAVLSYFQQRTDPNTGLLGQLPYWNFIDWSFSYKGIPEGGLTGNSSIISLQYVYTLQQAVELFRYFGWTQKSEAFLKQADAMKKAVYRYCFDQTRGLLADSPEKKSFSQHANIWGILTGCIDTKDQKQCMIKVIKDKSLVPASLFYRFYYAQALKKAGLGNLYIASLTPWKNMLQSGLTTFPETTSPRVRSDCHAWSASPCYDFLATICGIEATSPGFKTVRIAPNLGGLHKISCRVPIGRTHTFISVRYEGTEQQGYRATINLPEGIAGVFWTGVKNIALSAGTQVIHFRQERSSFEDLFAHTNADGHIK